MRHTLKTLCLTAALAACAPAWADLVVFEAVAEAPGRSGFKVTFNSTDTVLSFDEIVGGSSTGMEAFGPPSVK